MLPARYLCSAVLTASIVLPARAQFVSVRVQVLDRGQADGIVIRTPNSEWVVIDAGSNRAQADYMEQMGIETVALAITSHRHFDHFGGMDDVLRRFEVERYVANVDDCPNRAQDDTIRAIVNDRAIATQGYGLDTITVDGVRFIILPDDPTSQRCPREENDNSVVVRMEYGEFSMLLAGDAETEEREWLMEHHPDLLDVDVLKASHHGSSNGADGEVNGDSWMDIVNPSDVVISTLLTSPFGHPHGDAMDAFEGAVSTRDIHCTSRHGTIRVYGRPDGRSTIRRQVNTSQSCRFGS